MVDRTRIEQAKQVDLLALIGDDTELKQVSYREHTGPCPFCGGADRFSVVASEGKWYCRRCMPRGDDAIGYVCRRDNLSFWAAVSEILRHGEHFFFRRQGGSGGGTPRSPDPPPSQWQACGFSLVESARKTLWSPVGTQARNWLQARGLHSYTICKASLGYDTGEDAVLIPNIIGDTLWSLKLRRLSDEPRYHCLLGSRLGTPYLFDMRTSASSVVLCEGELDALLLWQECRSVTDVLTFGSATIKPCRDWLDRILCYKSVKVALDDDDCGELGASYWLSLTNGQGKRLKPFGKDITKSYLDGADLRSWVAV